MSRRLVIVDAVLNFIVVATVELLLIHRQEEVPPLPRTWETIMHYVSVRFDRQSLRKRISFPSLPLMSFCEKSSSDAERRVQATGEDVLFGPLYIIDMFSKKRHDVKIDSDSEGRRLVKTLKHTLC